MLTERQLRRAMEFRERCPDKALEEILLDFGYVSEAALLACLGERDGLEVVDLSEYKVDPEASGLISHNFADQYQVLPIGIRNGKLVVAARDPLMFDVFDEIEAAAGMELTVVLAAAESIRNCAAAAVSSTHLALPNKGPLLLPPLRSRPESGRPGPRILRAVSARQMPLLPPAYLPRCV